MKNLFQSILSVVIILLFAVMLPACKRENVSAKKPGQGTLQNTITKDAGKPEKTAGPNSSNDCVQGWYNADDETYPFRYATPAIIKCFYRILDYRWPFVDESWRDCFKVIPNWKEQMRTPLNYALFSVNEKTVCVLYDKPTLNRNAEYFSLNENVTLTREVAQQLRVNGRILRAGRYLAGYDAESDSYVAFIPVQQ